MSSVTHVTLGEELPELHAARCGRTDLAKRRVPTPLVIEHNDVIEQLALGLVAAVEEGGDLDASGGELVLTVRARKLPMR